MVSAFGNWEDVNTLINLVIQYYTGNSTIFAIVISALFLMAFIVRGIDIKYASLFTLPVIAGFMTLGYISSNIILMILALIIALFYARAVLKMYASWIKKMIITCLRCGEKYKTASSIPYVMSCHMCTKKFDNKTYNNIIKDFKTGNLWKKKY